MNTLESIDLLPAGLRFVATVGVFDGVHRGHQLVLRQTIRVAHDERAASVVVTFTPHPDAVVRGSAPALVCEQRERLARMRELGIDTVVVQPFDQAFAAQAPEVFIDRLARTRHLAGLVMSAESAFGRDRHGTIEAARQLARRRGFRVVEAPSLAFGGERVTSSRIREAVSAGRLFEAARMLGRRYAVTGEVVHGDRRGRELGYPTANLSFPDEVALPPNGVYAVRVSWGGEDPLEPLYRRDGVASLGVRPTFGGGARLLEAHLFDFDGDLYGKQLRVEFVRRQRGEKRFPSADALVAQMDRDAARARRILTANRQPRSVRLMSSIMLV